MSLADGEKLFSSSVLKNRKALAKDGVLDTF